MSALVLPKEFAYPAAAVLSTFYLLFWQHIRVGSARKRAGIPYPQVYAEKSELVDNKEALKFNCVQRAHQNTLENIPIVIGSTIIAGINYPVLAGALGGLWVFSRIFYTIGYASGDPKKRNLLGAGGFGPLSVVGLIGASTATIISLLRSL